MPFGCLCFVLYLFFVYVMFVKCTAMTLIWVYYAIKYLSIYLCSTITPRATLGQAINKRGSQLVDKNNTTVTFLLHISIH